jgi:hypothetical protein
MTLPAFEFLSENPLILIPLLGVLIGLVVLYLVLMARAVIEMLRFNVHGVLLTFAFLSLIPIPFIVIMGVFILIIWRYHKRDILAGKVRGIEG